MNDLGTLRKSAEESASFRGHTLVWLVPWHGERTSTQHGYCSACGAGVDLNMNPLPNGIDIGGEAVAIHCRKAEKTPAPKFLSKTNSPAVARHILRCAKSHFGDIALNVRFKHGQWFVVRTVSGVQYLAIDTEGQGITGGIDFRKVTNDKQRT
jgi:hypothetical protein